MTILELIISFVLVLGLCYFFYLVGFIRGKFTDTARLYRKIEEQEKELINLRGFKNE